MARLGDYIDDYCSRCKFVSDHAVVAMVGEEVKKVRCRTCNNEHNYRGGKNPKEMTNKEAFDAVLAKVTGTAPPAEEKPKRGRKKST